MGRLWARRSIERLNLGMGNFSGDPRRDKRRLRKGDRGLVGEMGRDLIGGKSSIIYMAKALRFAEDGQIRARTLPTINKDAADNMDRLEREAGTEYGSTSS